MDCECGGPVFPMPHTSTSISLYFCKRCLKVWRLDSMDNITGDCVLVDYEGELQDAARMVEDLQEET